MRHNIYIYIYSQSPHLHQAITGFLSLQESKRIRVTFVKEQMQREKIELPHDHCLIAYAGNKTLVFDMADGYNFKPGFNFSSLLKNVDWYFKRSFSDQRNRELLGDSPLISKIFPYGFNYYVTHPRIPATFKERLWNAAFYVRQICTFHGVPDSFWTSKRFEKAPIKVSTPPKIFFLTRLWPEKEYSKKEDREYINEMRVELVRNLKSTYGENFVGGVSDSELARETCPDIILPDSMSSKENYIKVMQNADICVGSIGLHQSIGWKTGEYVASSKAIVNEKFAYEVTGNFQEGRNYLPYTTVEECLQAVDFLVKNPDVIANMSQANWEYYNNYGSPLKLIENALQTAEVM